MRLLLSLVLMAPLLKFKVGAVDMDLYQPSGEVEPEFEGFFQE